MDLFNNMDKVQILDNGVSKYAENNGYGLLKQKEYWNIFQRDELKVQISFVRINNKDQVELKVKLLEDIDLALSIEVRPLCNEKIIKSILKRDLITQYEDKYFLVRYINLTQDLFSKDRIGRNINSLLKKQNKLQKLVYGLIDFIMGIKLN